VSAGPVVAVGPAPNVLFGFALGLRWNVRGSGAFAPGLSLTGVAAEALDATERTGTASFRWYTAHLIVDVLRVPLSSVALRAGLSADLGMLHASGAETTSPARSSRLWASLGVSAALEVPIAKAFAIAPVLGVQAPLRRDTYAFGPTDFFQEPVVVATIAVQGELSWR
jgi:hypothetical protein